MADRYLDRLRAAVSLAEVAGEACGCELKRRGARLYGACPLGDCGSDSFSVDEGRGLFFCHGCGAGGNVFEFVKRWRGVGFKDAMVWISARGGQPAPGQGRYPWKRASKVLSK